MCTVLETNRGCRNQELTGKSNVNAHASAQRSLVLYQLVVLVKALLNGYTLAYNISMKA
jgi:hypothetical protein